MCGRYALTTPPQVLQALFQLPQGFELTPRYNVAPTQMIPVVRARREGPREMISMRWGLIPRWAKDISIGARMINARNESVADKPAFREAFRRRRCLIPASAFYEWKKLGDTRQPYCIHRLDEEPFAFAGLWESWTERETGEHIESCTILTTDANELVADLHDRMPVIIRPADFDRWLDLEQREPEALKAMLRPAPGNEMAAYPVSARVNKPANDDPSLLERVEEAVPEQPSDDGQPGLFG